MLLVDFGIAIVAAIWQTCNFMELHMVKSWQIIRISFDVAALQDFWLRWTKNINFQNIFSPMIFFQNNEQEKKKKAYGPLYTKTSKERNLQTGACLYPLIIRVMTPLLPIIFARNSNKMCIKK